MTKTSDNKKVGNRLTLEQEQAIGERGKNLLVSASAGSGKTFVMIERIKEMITRKEVGVDEILVVTFTKAAASEMKERLKKGIEAIEPKTEYILEQLSSIQSASISTLHSFCAKLLKTYFYVIGLDPSFILIDELEASALRSKALTRLIDGRFKVGDKMFFDLLDIFSVNRKEENFREIIIKFYNYLLTQVYPDEWLNDVTQRAFCEDLTKNSCAVFLNSYVVEEFDKLKNEAKQLGEILAECGQTKLIEVLSSIEINLLKISNKASFLENAERIQAFEKVKALPTKVDESAVQLKEMVRDFKSRYQKAKELAEKYYLFDKSGNAIERMRVTKKRIEALAEYTKQFKDIYNSLKREKIALDFSDLEEYTLKLLENPQIRAEIQDKYKYVFIDEYQDTNLIQEEIIRKITRKDNLFMVGDVKQSIYKFRASEPEIFVQKYNFYKSGANPINKAINLNQNFRSHQDILNFSNIVFSRAMTSEFGQVDYKRDAMLVKGGENFPKVTNMPSVSVALIEGLKEKREEIIGPLPIYSVKNHNKDDEILTIKKAEAEGKIVAKKIKDLLNEQIYDAKQNQARPIGYKDIAILTASRGNYLDLILKELGKVKIPFSSDIELGVFEDSYVGTLRSFLELIQNPEQDMHLISVLNSIMFDFSINDLAQIRILEPDKRFFHQAFKAVSENEKTAQKLKNKINNFFAVLNEFSLYSKFMKVSELILEIINKTGYLNKIHSQVDADKSVKLIYKLISFLADKSYNSSLSMFLDYIKDNEIKFGMDENVGGVTVTTIHKSKGLEYPVVIMVGAGQPILKRNRGEFLISKKFGVGIDFYDSERRIKQRTLQKNAITLESDITEKEERLRLLYVALTRAVNHLIIVGCEKETRKEVEASCAENFLDWIEPVLTGDNAFYVVERYDARELKLENNGNCKNSQYEVKFSAGDEKQKQEIARVLTYTYPYEKVMNMPIKTSVSEILKQDTSEYFVPTAFEPTGNADAIKKGLNYHKVLSLIDLKADTPQKLDSDIRKNLEKGLLTIEDLEMVDTRDILELLLNTEFRELTRGKLIKEQEFIALTKMQKNAGELILQGVVDLISVTDDGIIVVDYKTNNSKREEFYIDKYKKQLDLYAEVASSSLDKKVIKKLIYSFALKKFIRV